jgi:hypothetical protein
MGSEENEAIDSKPTQYPMAGLLKIEKVKLNTSDRTMGNGDDLIQGEVSWSNLLEQRGVISACHLGLPRGKPKSPVCSSPGANFHR